jgi:hypothetical protein
MVPRTVELFRGGDPSAPVSAVFKTFGLKLTEVDHSVGELILLCNAAQVHGNRPSFTGQVNQVSAWRRAQQCESEWMSRRVRA